MAKGLQRKQQELAQEMPGDVSLLCVCRRALQPCPGRTRDSSLGWLLFKDMERPSTERP